MKNNGVTYYYIYEELAGEATCYLDTYNEGKYYTIDVSILNSNEEECIKTGFNIYENLIQNESNIVNDEKQNNNEKGICLIPFI